MIDLLFPRKRPVNRRREIVRIPLSQTDYSDIGYIRDIITEGVKLPANAEIPIRVKLIRSEPCRAFRATILCNFKEQRSVKNKDGGTSLLKSGLGIYKQFWIEKVSESEFLFSPPLTGE